MKSTHVYYHEKNYSVQATSKTTHLTPLNDKLPIVPVKLHTTKKLPPTGKEYSCFQIHGRSSHAAQCVKSQIMNNAIDYILSIETYEQQYVVNKGMLKSPRIDIVLRLLILTNNYATYILLNNFF